MEWLVAALVMMSFAGCATVAVAVRVIRAVRRRALALSARAGLTARACTAGPAGEVARLRRDVHRALSDASRALAVARVTDTPVGDVPSLLTRLEMAGSGIDGELRMLETLRDPARITSAIEGPRSRARAMVAAASDLTTGLLTAAGDGAVDMSLLQAECALEAEALRAARRPSRRTSG